MSVSDEKKIGGKLTEQQLAMDLNQLEKRSARSEEHTSELQSQR